ncbi:ABC transporter permease [Chelatococcus asaccharovorans]|uniref:Putative spermidine/putrescine transport system permease protein n=1 Tax=Chelatococcus asaccharovorans TaxID=28210 RepID=A0A2V3TUB7_9HYPH|nr:ABC transporter permease [Chelatococcus asaccharovorans]MBS7702053.1 ABC transporter permease [Chelatococcus asaccharovorans]PXW52823.1 putative spermidine/putrescine transport system permease protein [Chelatococcus asaccharovorans]
MRMRVVLALLLPVLLLLAVFFVVPIITVLAASFDTSDPQRVAGWAAYWKLASDTYYVRVFIQTFVFAIALTVLTLLFGYPIASFIARTSAVERGIVIFLVIAPLLISMVVRSYGWQLILGNSGLVNTVLAAAGLVPVHFMAGWTAVTIASVHVLLPFAVISIAGVLSSLDRSIEESAAVLGASPVKVFFLVTLPMALNGLVTAATFVFLLAMGSFVTIMMLGGRGTMVVPLLIYQQVTITYDQPFASAMAAVLMVVTLGMLFGQFRLLRKRSV